MQPVSPEQIECIELKVHSLVPEPTGKKEPADRLQAKLSGMLDAVIGAAKTADWIRACWALGTATGVRELTALARP